MSDEAFFYLADIETQTPLARFPYGTCRSGEQIVVFEKAIRARHRVDDPESGLVLHDNGHRPLPRKDWPSIQSDPRAPSG